VSGKSPGPGGGGGTGTKGRWLHSHEARRERERTRRFFNLVAPAFHLIDRRLLPEYRAALAEIDLDPALSVLDMATGTGTLAAAFAERGHPVTGFDFAARLLRRARTRVPAARFDHMDLADLPTIPDGAYGVAAMAYLLHGLAPRMRLFVLREAARIATDSVLVFDYDRPGPWIVRAVERVEGPHYPSFVATPFADLAAAAGLAVLRSAPTSDYGGYWLLRRDAPAPPSSPMSRS